LIVPSSSYHRSRIKGPVAHCMPNMVHHARFREPFPFYAIPNHRGVYLSVFAAPVDDSLVETAYHNKVALFDRYEISQCTAGVVSSISTVSRLRNPTGATVYSMLVSKFIQCMLCHVIPEDQDPAS
jgi:hypothetical protein